MNRRIVFFIAILFFAYSCADVEKFGVGVETIHLKESKDFLPISSFVKDLNYLELEFPEEKVEIGEIEGIKIIGKDLIIKQRKARESGYLRFSDDGKFKNEIGRIKKGKKIDKPGDIIAYKNDFIVRGQDALYRISKDGKKVNRIVKTNNTGQSLFFMHDWFYLLSDMNDPGYMCGLSEKGDSKKVFKPSDTALNMPVYTSVSKLARDEYHLYSVLKDTVFAFSNSRFVPKYILDGSPNPTYIQVVRQVGDKSRLETLRYINNNQHVSVRNYLENKNYIYITYWVGSNASNVLINKRNNELVYFASGINDVDGGIWENPLYLSENDVLYIPIYPYRIENHKILNKRRKGFKKLQERTEADGNPVIMRCRLK